MWPYHPELLARAVPRYTSYPTAAEFTPSVGAEDQLSALRGIAPGTSVSLYVHIPFCQDICWYCGCNTNRSNRTERVAAYLEALEAEIDWLARHLSGRVSLGRISFGGGSPNALDPLGFVRLVSQILTAFQASSPEISVELDPRSLDSEWAGLLGKVGATRASLGVQTLAPAVQARIGRVQPVELIERSVAMLRDAGVTSLNFDLMYGLPGQTMDDLESSLARTVELGADRIALFGYAHVPHMIPRQRRIDATALPEQAERFAMAARGYEFLTAAGYLPVGFDHFAEPGDPMGVAAREGRVHRNFQGFTDDAAPALVGVGASAISCFPDVLVQNEKNAGRYRMLLSQDRLSGVAGIVRSAADRELGAIITALLCQGEARVGKDRLAGMACMLHPFVTRGVAEVDGDTLRIPPRGLPYARTIAALFDPYRQDSLRRFSSAV